MEEGSYGLGRCWLDSSWFSIGVASSFQHDVEAVAQGPFRLRRFEVEGRDHTLSSLSVPHRLEDGILLEERVAGEVHLGYEPAPERRSEQREVYVRRAPGVVVILPGISSRLYRHEPVAAFAVGEASPRPREVRVERSRVLVQMVCVASGGVGLPDLDEAVTYRASVTIEHTSRDDYPLPRGSPPC